ncbi:hypothetical protein HNR23_000501 [Nocardiopsis mwathae]|uniref:Spore-associated protein A n=1 Tax=Nocardiopsis mwathae TaxID=1472723 RepID=A0A7W9YFR6_9ACTN|nr:serine/threonine protein kinase [Nocardiopsis mwathae]MBB6170441.1 hypothetical protein [Nocardiopsis mwathae]
MNKLLSRLGATGVLLAGSLAFATPAEAATNPYTPQGVCGSGYREINRHVDRGSIVYLMYNGSSNCVVTIKTTNIGKVTETWARLDVQGESTQHDNKKPGYKYYAGPLKAPAKGKCVRWGGGQGTYWVSGWSHCG